MRGNGRSWRSWSAWRPSSAAQDSSRSRCLRGSVVAAAAKKVGGRTGGAKGKPGKPGGRRAKESLRAKVAAGAAAARAARGALGLWQHAPEFLYVSERLGALAQRGAGGGGRAGRSKSSRGRSFIKDAAGVGDFDPRNSAWLPMTRSRAAARSKRGLGNFF
jgi:hypothetical protein